MSVLYMEWGEDLVITPNGSLQLARGWDEARQRIERRLFTNAQEVLPGNVVVAPDYLFDINYGIGCAKKVGEPMNADLLGDIRQRVNQGVMVDDAVSDALPPSIQMFRQQNGTLLLIIGVPLKTGEVGQIAIQT